jgi:hypothetical protein
MWLRLSYLAELEALVAAGECERVDGSKGGGSVTTAEGAAADAAGIGGNLS